MLDVVDFIEERGGDPKKIKESQRRRFAPEEAVDEVIALYEDHRTSALPPLRAVGLSLLTSIQPSTKPNRLVPRSMLRRRR